MEIIHVTMTTLPKNKDKFKGFLQNIVTKARTLKGCLKFDWYIDPENANSFILYAEFGSGEDYTFYKQSNVLKDINHQLFPLFSIEPTFKQFRAEIIIDYNS